MNIKYAAFLCLIPMFANAKTLPVCGKKAEALLEKAHMEPFNYGTLSADSSLVVYVSHDNGNWVLVLQTPKDGAEAGCILYQGNNWLINQNFDSDDTPQNQNVSPSVPDLQNTPDNRQE